MKNDSYFNFFYNLEKAEYLLHQKEALEDH